MAQWSLRSSNVAQRKRKLRTSKPKLIVLTKNRRRAHNPEVLRSKLSIAIFLQLFPSLFFFLGGWGDLCHVKIINIKRIGHHRCSWRLQDVVEEDAWVMTSLWSRRPSSVSYTEVKLSGKHKVFNTKTQRMDICIKSGSWPPSTTTVPFCFQTPTWPVPDPVASPQNAFFCPNLSQSVQVRTFTTSSFLHLLLHLHPVSS